MTTVFQGVVGRGQKCLLFIKVLHYKLFDIGKKTTNILSYGQTRVRFHQGGEYIAVCPLSIKHHFF